MQERNLGQRFSEITFSLKKLENQQEMFSRMLNFKFLPGGRGLKNLGTKKTDTLDLNSST